MSITIDNIKTWKDWGMVLTAAKDKKPETKNGVWSADWTENDLLKAQRIAVFHEPDKRGVKGLNILTIDFDCKKFIANNFSSLFPASFSIGKKDSTGRIRPTHIEYEIDPADKPRGKDVPKYEGVIEVLTSTCSIIAGKDRYIITNVKPLRLSKTQLESVLVTVKVVNFLRELFIKFPEKGNRDEVYLRLAGALTKDTELSTELKEKMIDSMCYATGDLEINKRVKKVAYQEKQLEAGQEIAGIKSLCEILNVKNTSPLAKAFDELKPKKEEDKTAADNEEDKIDYNGILAYADLDTFLTTDFPQPSYIIEPLVSAQSIVEIVGASGVGKTMFGLAIAGAISSASGLLGMPSVGGARPILYVEGELPSADVQKRINGMIAEIKRNCKSDMFYTSTLQQQMLINPGGFVPINTPQGLINIENTLLAIKKRTGIMPVVFIDNISCLASGMKENEADAWSPIINKFVKWKNMGSTVFYFHHLNKGNDSSGSTMQHRTIDMVIRMRMPDNKQKIKEFDEKGVQAIVDFPKWRLHDNSKHAKEHMLICEDWKWEKLPVLTSDELDIVRMYNEDLDVKEMSKEINLAEKTIYKKLKNLKDKGVIKDGIDKETINRTTKEVC